jgi:hypothetical protein
MATTTTTTVRATRQRHMSRVANPNSSRTLFLETRPGTPKAVEELGGLSQLVLDSITLRSRALKRIAPPRLLSEDNDSGDTVWKFDCEVKLVADSNGDLHVAGYYRSLPEGVLSGRSYFLGHVVSLVYMRADAKVRGKSQGALVPHAFAQHGGEYPRLFYKDGFLLFRGGTYSVIGRGLEG